MPKVSALKSSVQAGVRFGLTVIPAPTGFLHRGRNDDALPRLPNMNSAFAGTYAIHEWLGLVAYRVSR